MSPNKYLLWSVMLLILKINFPVSAQTIGNITVIKGIVTDAETNEPLSFTAVMLNNSPRNATATNDEGLFSITSADTISILKVSCMGYETVFIGIQLGKRQYISVKLKPSSQQLTEVVIKGKRKRYKNKGNLAVELIQKVIDNKPRNRAENLNYLEYEKYQKTVFSINKMSDKLKDNRMLQPFRFVFDNVDTTIVPGSELIPIYLKESLSDNYFRKDPHTAKEIVKAEKLVRFDEYINRRSVAASIDYLYQDVNIYDNDINLMTNQFLSPIASLAPTFYKYFLKDTSYIDSVKCVKLNFGPRNKTDLLLEGDMYITLDSSYAVKKIDMTINKNANLNWVRDLSIIQEFDKTDNNGWLVSRDEMGVDFGITQESVGLYGKRATMYHDCKINKPANDTMYNGLSQVMAPGAEDRDNDYWTEHRHQELRQSEANIYSIMDSLQRVPAFKRDVGIINIFSAGYLKAKWFELGPVFSFYSYNPVEGSRVKFGGRTTPLFSKKINFETYMAYGFNDKKYKSYLGVTYSFTDKTIYDFPVKSLEVSYQDDIKIPGQELQFAQPDNVLLSIKHGTNNKMYYNRTYRVEHLNEFANHFSYDIAYEYSRKTPAGDLYFNTESYLQQTNTTSYIDVSQASIALRYAPHEKFFQGSMYRTPFTNKYPVLQLQYSIAHKTIGSDYNFQNLKVSLSKRFYMSVFGYTDVLCEAGKVFGRVPYLLLDIANANQTYSYQPKSYNLMNFLEFISDQYVAVNVNHCFNGFFFNKVPLLKKLKFREVATCKILYGNLSKTNNPAYHSDLFQLPTDDQGLPLTYTLEKKPYAEVGVGIANIFRIFRVDYIQRISYLNHHDISKAGLRFSLKADF
jgi:hypothetical protein